MTKKCSTLVFVENSASSDETVKRHYLELVKYECVECKISSYNGKPLTLQLDHINGTHTDCRFENLRLLCANCHSQTPTYAGRQHWNNINVTDSELIDALETCPTITAALREVKMDTGRTEYFGRANFIINTCSIIVGNRLNTYNALF